MYYLERIISAILINNLLGLTPGAANVTGNISVTFVCKNMEILFINIRFYKGLEGSVRALCIFPKLPFWHVSYYLVCESINR